MITKDSYVVKRNNCTVWLSHLVEPLPTDEIVEVRPKLVADDGKMLFRDGEEVGSAIWLKDSEATDYTESEIVEEPEEIEINEEPTDI